HHGDEKREQHVLRQHRQAQPRRAVSHDAILKTSSGERLPREARLATTTSVGGERAVYADLRRCCHPAPEAEAASTARRSIPGICARTVSADACTRNRAWCAYTRLATASCTYVAASGAARGRKRQARADTSVIRSTRKLRQSSRSRS